ncbi:MAG: hypothetical protein JWL65_3966 [Gammaproteobacteria bacterium]|nr:hypothetical protein [Gammaproteobacteria bacterium]
MRATAIGRCRVGVSSLDSSGDSYVEYLPKKG